MRSPRQAQTSTATLEHKPAANLVLKLEGRYDRSSADVFADETTRTDGNPQRKNSQLLLLFGATAFF